MTKRLDWDRENQEKKMRSQGVERVGLDFGTDKDRPAPRQNPGKKKAQVPFRLLMRGFRDQVRADYEARKAGVWRIFKARGDQD